MSCGGGSHGRVKTITQNATHGGNDCEGPFDETQKCNNYECAGMLVHINNSSVLYITSCVIID